jgi:hypothetical protein
MEQNGGGGIRGAKGGRSIAFPPLENSILTSMTIFLPLPHKATRRYLLNCYNCPRVKSLLSFTFNSLCLSLLKSFDISLLAARSGERIRVAVTTASTGRFKAQLLGSDRGQICNRWVTAGLEPSCIAWFFALVISNYIEAIRQSRLNFLIVFILRICLELTAIDGWLRNNLNIITKGCLRCL